MPGLCATFNLLILSRAASGIPRENEEFPENLFLPLLLFPLTLILSCWPRVRTVSLWSSEQHSSRWTINNYLKHEFSSLEWEEVVCWRREGTTFKQNPKVIQEANFTESLHCLLSQPKQRCVTGESRKYCLWYCHSPDTACMNFILHQNIFLQ